MRIVSGVLIQKDNTFLLVQEGAAHLRGVWSFPGGKIDEGENPEDAAVREAKEEAGVDVRILEKIGVFQMPGRLQHLYKAEIIGGKINYPKDELMDCRWVTVEDIEHEKIRGPWMLEVMKQFIKHN